MSFSHPFCKPGWPCGVLSVSSWCWGIHEPRPRTRPSPDPFPPDRTQTEAMCVTCSIPSPSLHSQRCETRLKIYNHCCVGFTLAVTCVRTGSTGRVWASRRNARTSWTATCVWTARATRTTRPTNCTASAERLTTRHSQCMFAHGLLVQRKSFGMRY